MVLRDVRGMYNDLDASLLNGRNEISACRQDEKSNTIGIYTTSAATYDVLPCLGDRVSFLCAARVVIFATSLINSVLVRPGSLGSIPRCPHRCRTGKPLYRHGAAIPRQPGRRYPGRRAAYGKLRLDSQPCTSGQIL